MKAILIGGTQDGAIVDIIPGGGTLTVCWREVERYEPLCEDPEDPILWAYLIA